MTSSWVHVCIASSPAPLLCGSIIRKDMHAMCYRSLATQSALTHFNVLNVLQVQIRTFRCLTVSLGNDSPSHWHTS